MLTKTLVKTMVQKMNQESEGHEEIEKDEEDEVEPQEDEEPRGGGLTDAEEQAGEDLKLDDYDPNPAPLEPPTSDELQQYMTSRCDTNAHQTVQGGHKNYDGNGAEVEDGWIYGAPYPYRSRT